MADNTQRQFREADAAIDRSVAAFIIKIKSMSLKWNAVSRQYIVEGVLLKLCDEMTKLIDKPALANTTGPAMTKLSNALADYRDSQAVER